MKFLKIILPLVMLSAPAWANSLGYVGGFNLTEDGDFMYDAAPAGQPETPAQQAVDKAKALGANHIILNVRATMTGPYSSEIIPVTPPSERSKEALRMAKLIKYIQSQGMTAGIRPIFFVVGPHGEFPYVEQQPDGQMKTWWHGNIQPADPNRWFESFRVYLDIYITVAKLAKADEFTIGAELYSMTVGIEDQWKEYPYGFPGRWLELLRYVRAKLPQARLMYDINFTDDSVNTGGGVTASGGELERWRYRIVDLADRTNPAEKQIWTDLTTFWQELDAVGIDMYRSLASENQPLPSQYDDLVKTLKQRSDSYATQLDNTMTQIELTLGAPQNVILKEVGFRSVDRGFIDPFAYAGPGTVNEAHQAAAYQAIFESFWQVNWPWFKGINFWDISINPDRTGDTDTGFSPLGKTPTEDVIKANYGQ